MKKVLAIIFIIIMTVLFFINSYQSALDNISMKAISQKNHLNNIIQSSIQLVDDLILYGELFLSHNINDDSPFYELLEYNEKTNTYNLNMIQNTANEQLVGNLNGIGTIPNEGIHKQEINLALDYNRFFHSFSNKFQNIDWMYYVSENNFLCAYPWAPLTRVAYSHNLKSQNSYLLAGPSHNPSREQIWTPAYLDASKSKILVALSKPLYFENQFMGVVSINFTNATLRGLPQYANNFYLLDNNGFIISSSQTDAYPLMNIGEVLGITDDPTQIFLGLEKDCIHNFNNYYLYLTSCNGAPWTIAIITPVWQVILSTTLYVIPLMIIGIFVVVILYENNKRKEAETMLFNQSIHDPLTGIYNRRFFTDALKHTTAMYQRTRSKFSIVMADIDFFKKINDTAGHSKGDEVLMLVSSILKSSVRHSDIVSRWGGEEFIVLLPETKAQDAQQLAERIRQTINNTNFGLPWQVTCSFGVATMPDNATDMTGLDLVNLADEALYAAKETGRNKVICHNSCQQK